jgi:hypothetical protein
MHAHGTTAHCCNHESNTLPSRYCPTCTTGSTWIIDRRSAIGDQKGYRVRRHFPSHRQSNLSFKATRNYAQRPHFLLPPKSCIDEPPPKIPPITESPASTPDSITELTNQLNALTRLVQKSSPTQSNHLPRCLWCDSYDHLQDHCHKLTFAIKAEKVLYRSIYRILNSIEGAIRVCKDGWGNR